mmetsp:Transcript_42853/g.118472  ORF Transcript_42853/g.118472 Transcript_42853/m.118472 type:complete len:264 (-) Transcript_42853:98-889(-)|eukprot:CAMPEP_0117555258 /NCGR_PEP_ID=MMETSP0784-20121206/51182_1 /TAXON_ID=39447 /ORGANISM="" /LENGTH=263 /DNA_ID=CAMNT_0005352459 /DNA_START=76 /DNA_END=867 /DNA_ORIENTATION=+
MVATVDGRGDGRQTRRLRMARDAPASPRRPLSGVLVFVVAAAVLYSAAPIAVRTFTAATGSPAAFRFLGADGFLAAAPLDTTSEDTRDVAAVALHARKDRAPRETADKGMASNTWRFKGSPRFKMLERLKHRRWAAQSKYPRIFGFVEKWDDRKGEGIIRDQEKTQNYFVIRDEITRCYHKHASLQRAEMVEFFATDEVDSVANLPLAKNVSGPMGEYVKGCEEYRSSMLRSGQFPKRFSDNDEDYPKFRYKDTEFWRHIKKS